MSDEEEQMRVFVGQQTLAFHSTPTSAVRKIWLGNIYIIADHALLRRACK